MDTDGSGEIDYSEFLAAIMDSQLMERRDILWAAFQDVDVESLLSSFFLNGPSWWNMKNSFSETLEIDLNHFDITVFTKLISKYLHKEMT